MLLLGATTTDRSGESASGLASGHLFTQEVDRKEATKYLLVEECAKKTVNI